MKFFFARSFHLFAKGLKLELATHDISEQDASRFRWNELKDFFVSAQDDLMYGEGEEGVEMLLPDVLIPGSDLALVRFGEAMPTYITDSVVKARLCVLETLGVKADVVGAIVLLPNADPGYDFLFHSGAVGIITKVGGPASHMCIRSTELQMPACIGCGESLYQNLAGARSVMLDCSTQQIIALE